MSADSKGTEHATVPSILSPACNKVGGPPNTSSDRRQTPSPSSSDPAKISTASTVVDVDVSYALAAADAENNVYNSLHRSSPPPPYPGLPQSNGYDSKDRRRVKRIWLLLLKLGVLALICGFLLDWVRKGGGYRLPLQVLGDKASIITDQGSWQEQQTSNLDMSFANCPGQSAAYGRNLSFEMGGKDLRFAQSTKYSNFGHSQNTQVDGKVSIFVREDIDKVLVHLAIATTDEDLKDSFNYVVNDHGLDVKINLNAVPYTVKRSCMTINVDVSIPSSHVFNSFAIAVESLDIAFHTSAGSFTAEKMDLRTTTGFITSASTLTVPALHVFSVAGDITGTYALNTSLVLRTTTGAIDVIVEPQNFTNSNKSDPGARLEAKSVSGSIQIHTCPPSSSTNQHLPERNFTTTVGSVSGSITGSYIAGALTRIESVSGLLDLVFIPALAAPGVGVLDTETKHGMQAVSFAGELGSISTLTNVQRGCIGVGKGSGKRGIRARHASISGSLDLHYPRDWEGEIVARSISGGADIVGNGVHIDRRDGWPIGEVVKAHKGDRSRGRIWAENVSGRVFVGIGV